MVFEDIYSEFYPRVFRLCMGYVNDTDRAQDIAQDTFIAVWKHLPGFRNESSVGTWIFRIATNNCLRSVATEQRKGPRHELPLHLPEAPAPETEERMHLLYTCIAQLKEAERIIISLVLEGLPQAEIAAIAGISEGNIRVKVHRIKEQLTQKFKAHGQL
jgi:RNA polymerase sigma-70 factor (ECF subfamily)